MTMLPPQMSTETGPATASRATVPKDFHPGRAEFSVPALLVRGLEHAFANAGSNLPVLNDTAFEIAQGSFVSLIGPSGCGKSTLLRCCAGLLHPDAGEILIAGRPPRAAQRARSIGVVFQDPALLAWKSIRRNVSLPFDIAGRSHSEAEVDRLLDLVGLSGFGDYRPDQLSGGMKQRAALARALALQPSLLLMDEPFAALDEITRADLRDQLLRIWGRQETTVLLVTHSITDAVLLSDRILVMSPRPGRLIADMTIELPRPRDGSLEFEPAFVRHAAELRRLLRGGVK